jgi:chemotaxis protein methyltransferase CheR
VDVKILATDISTQALAVARDGVYAQRKVAPVPEALRHRYFDRIDGPLEPVFRVRPVVRSLVAIHRLNLATPPFPMSGPFDAVLCRNVMIYFDDAVRRRLLDEVFRLVGPGGHLMVGHAECLTGLLSHFKSLQPSLYRKVR